MLEQAGIWPHLDPKAVWPLRQARVRDRGLPFRLDVDNSGDASGAPLGWLVSNWRIRKAAFDAASSLPGWQLLDAPMLCGLARHAQGWQLQMADGRHLQAATVIAADSRFSPTRRLLGVGARSRDHGMAMLACNVQLERDHGGQAWQWFGDGCTHALLPLQPGVASAVLTLPTAQAQALLAAGAGTYGARVSTPFEHRWGNMQACSSAHLYPMVSVYADRFAGPGFAVAGDAAVGMYSDMRMPARIIRGGALALAAALPPFPALLRRHLTATA
jgi:2-polyprenyl-6-methoxyphenol hydroxylase-like FAD-dependent oxidoreductase